MTRMLMRRGAGLVLLGCTRESPATLPEPPDVAAPSPAPAEVSRIRAPIEYDFTAVLRLVEQIVPKKFGSIDSVKQMGTDSRRHYAWEAMRGPFTAFATGNQLHLRTTLEYSAKGYYKPPIGPTVGAGCGGGKERPRIVVELATPISLTPVWTLATTARVVTVAPATSEPRDHCDVSIFNKDVTPQVIEAARSGLVSQLPAIDRKLQAVSLKDHVNEWWGMLARPIQLAEGVWLVLKPERLRLGRVQGRSTTLIVPIALDARPVVVTGTEPPPARAVLPPLGKDTAGAEGYHVILDGLLDYGMASRELTAAFDAKSFSEAGHTVRLAAVSVIPQPKGRLAISAKFTGDVTGTLQLIGTPRIDRLHDELVVPDLDFDLRSDNPVLQSYSWLKSANVRRQLRDRARISTSDALAKGRDLLRQGLNRKLGDAVVLSGTVDSVAVRGLFVTRDGIVVRAEAFGGAGLSVKQQ